MRSKSCGGPVSPSRGNTECRLQRTVDVNGVRCWSAWWRWWGARSACPAGRCPAGSPCHAGEVCAAPAARWGHWTGSPDPGRCPWSCSCCRSVTRVKEWIWNRIEIVVGSEWGWYDKETETKKRKQCQQREKYKRKWFVTVKEKQPQLKSGMYEDLKTPVKAVKLSCWIYFLIQLCKCDVERQWQTSCKCGSLADSSPPRGFHPWASCGKTLLWHQSWGTECLFEQANAPFLPHRWWWRMDPALQRGKLSLTRFSNVKKINISKIIAV